jgi:hypothetical protein
MSTQGRDEDARWHLKRAAELRAKGRKLDARRHEKRAAETMAIFFGGGEPETVVPGKGGI